MFDIIKKNLHLTVISILTLFFLWLPEYPPMVDVPQHAAQVNTFIEMLKSNYYWQDEFELNLLTPYWIAYAPWIIFSLFTSITTAFKITISLFFILYVYSSYQALKEFKAPTIFTILIIPIFFGYSYEYGFLNYLAAIPIGILYFTSTLKIINKKASAREISINTALGVLLFFSHILILLFFALVTYTIIIYKFTEKKIDKRKLISLTIPYIIYLILIIAFILSLTGEELLSKQIDYGAFFLYSSGNNRFDDFLRLPWPGALSNIELSFLILYLLIIASPFIAGYKLSKDKTRYIPLMLAIIVFFTLPHYLAKTFFIYERYSFFYIFFYFFIFDDKTCSKKWSFIFLVFTLLSLYIPFTNILFYKKETSALSTIIEKIPEKKRVLSLVFETYSNTVKNNNLYVHAPLWYQAKKNGLVDFNFSWFQGLIVLYKPTHTPEVKPGFEWMPGRYIEIKNCSIYDYIVVKTSQENIPQKLDFSNCQFRIEEHNNFWYLYKLKKTI